MPEIPEEKELEELEESGMEEGDVLGGDISDPLTLTGKNPSCPVCKHPACDAATEVYFSSEYSIEAVSLFFKNNYRKEFSDSTLRRHFREHIEPFMKGFLVLKEKRLREIQEKVNSKDRNSVARVPMIKEMLFDFLTDVYAAKPENIRRLEDQKSLRELSETFVKLSKAFKDLHEMEMNLIGYGKTPEEQKEQVQGIIVGYLKQILAQFDDMPDAQKKLEDLISNVIGGNE